MMQERHVLTLYDLAQRYVGIREIEGDRDHPLVRWWHSLCTIGEQPDEVPWCSSFLNGMAWELRLPRSKDARARSWLRVGRPIPVAELRVGYDVVVLQRGTGEQPGIDVIDAPGHVALFAGWDSGMQLLGGNQGDAVSVARFDPSRVLGARRLWG